MRSSTTPAISRFEMTADQLALPSSERVTAKTKHGKVTGGRVKNGAQVFLNVPYALPVPRWTDPQPLPSGYTYPQKEYTTDGQYCAQPRRAYTAQIPVRDRLGLGSPTETPFFADIYVPSNVDLSSPTLRPVKVFLHGGFLQFGSTSGWHYNQQFFSAEHFGEVRVLLGHRVSVLGFLGCETPKISGNFGFKDVWTGLQWVQENIASFGGDPKDIHLSGLSGGAHIVHQMLHLAARRKSAPFISATLQSNAILTNPVSPASKAAQFSAFCNALGADEDLDLDSLRDEERYPTSAVIQAVENMGVHGTFRGVVEEGWVHPNQMEYQASGGLGRDLLAAGVKVVITGDVRDEGAFYSIVHDCTPETLLFNVARYYPLHVAEALLSAYDGDDDPQTRLGKILGDGQVHLPVRMLARDLAKAGLPTVRYSIEMVAKSFESGVVSHGTDLVFQHLRLSVLTREEVIAALEWHRALDEAVRPALEGKEFVQRGEEEMLLLNKLGETAWARDWRWPQLRKVEAALQSVDR